MVKMVSGMDHGRMHPMTTVTTRSQKTVAILQLIEGPKSGLELTVVTCFFKADCWPSTSFCIGSQARVRLTCCNQGLFSEHLQFVQGLKGTANIDFLSLWPFILCTLRLEKIKQDKQKTSPQSHKPYQKSNQNFWDLKNLAQELCFKA